MQQKSTAKNKIKKGLHGGYQVQWLVHFILALCVFTHTAPAPSLLSQLSDLSNHGLPINVLGDYSRSRRTDQYRGWHYAYGSNENGYSEAKSLKI
jgi:hypothetical protein